MIRLLGLIFGRLPIGWLQLSHNRARFAAAIAGVAFANVLVFAQLGVLGSLGNSIALTYAPMRADLIVSSADGHTLTDGSPVPRRLAYRALAVEGVAAAAPVYLARLDWIAPGGASLQLIVYGLPPEAERFAGTALDGRIGELTLADRALVDARTRGADRAALLRATPETPFSFEANGVSLTAVGAVEIGGGFAGDGALVVSDQTFLRLFGRRLAGTPSHVLLDVAPDADPADVAARVAAALAGGHVVVRPYAEAIEADLSYQTTERPVGVIFGFGTFIGLLVGLVIVYQVLATDVADHLREYATFKAIGYGHGFFLGIVLEEALVLAILGFVPAFALAVGLYAAMSAATGLPVTMEAARAAGVFVGCLAACVASGAFAARRLRAADPAELF